MKIVIAEDQPVAALFLRRILEKMGHEIIVTRDGEEAWDAVKGGAISLLISDWVMPRLDGPSLCRRIRSSNLDKYIYTILLTSRDSRVDKLEGLRAGADDFLTKPPDPDELEVRLEIAARILHVHDALARQNIRLTELATVDALTGVKNRRWLESDLQSHIAAAVREDRPLSVVMLDVDCFKNYNDAFGHPAGDEVLRKLADILLGVVRRNDVVARYGGEEFAILLPMAGHDEAMEVSRRIRQSLAQANWPHRPVTASLGVATLGSDVTPESLIDKADQALYFSKRTGRNRVTHYSVLEGTTHAAPIVV